MKEEKEIVGNLVGYDDFFSKSLFSGGLSELAGFGHALHIPPLVCVCVLSSPRSE